MPQRFITTTHPPMLHLPTDQTTSTTQSSTFASHTTDIHNIAPQVTCTGITLGCTATCGDILAGGVTIVTNLSTYQHSCPHAFFGDIVSNNTVVSSLPAAVAIISVRRKLWLITSWLPARASQCTGSAKAFALPTPASVPASAPHFVPDSAPNFTANSVPNSTTT
ncbi:hypothetical protein B0H10DRAFT_2222843 [Mycena sp. CBHHK59/15]|nr:hypothetical protein B0H10DRAFT_2222843 [Mycena sp. CBHHK59/15]